MTNVLDTDKVTLWHKHHANVVASLNHRLAIAKANQDQHLVELLEREQKQIAGDADFHPGSLHQHLATLWGDLVTLVRGDASLQVWQSVDQQGDRWWCAYNPQTGQSVYAESEAEMRIWIDANYSSDPC
ncbi:MAG: hypothetical protein NW224_24815 [Leptolyngbyaceae cyanobacterium bins.302]|nr:hypothetical protein [Leptolyngbyaceae cyanobacterium bins.302]